MQHLEEHRQNSIATRNVRLAALHTFVRFLAAENPESLSDMQAVLGIPFKRGEREEPMDYFESDEMRSFLQIIDRETTSGARDYVLFASSFNTGARVQEVPDLRVCDVRLDAPCQVRIHGKGNKVRLCPVWSGTADLMAKHIKTISGGGQEEIATRYVFLNQRGKQLTRFGVRYRLKNTSRPVNQTHRV